VWPLWLACERHQRLWLAMPGAMSRKPTSGTDGHREARTVPHTVATARAGTVHRHRFGFVGANLRRSTEARNGA